MIFRVLLILAIIISATPGSAFATSNNIPKWLSDDIAKRKGEGHVDYIREGEYEGKMVYLIMRPEMKGKLDQYVLVGSDQHVICTFGGPNVVVTSGKCEFIHIKFTREIQPLQQ